MKYLLDSFARLFDRFKHEVFEPWNKLYSSYKNVRQMSVIENGLHCVYCTPMGCLKTVIFIEPNN